LCLLSFMPSAADGALVIDRGALYLVSHVKSEVKTFRHG